MTQELTQDPVAAQQLLGGRYQLGSLLGHGGMAQVHAAHDLVLDRPVAVKVLRAGVAGHAFAQRQSAEARILARLDHPHLVRVYDADTDPSTGLPFLVMELIDGGTLAALLDRGPLSEVQVAALGQQLAGALAAIHHAGIVHRDIKPANVLLDHRNDPNPTATSAGVGGVDARLSDFGIARVLDASRLTTTGLMLGTAAYLSPEQARGQHVDCRSDVYSLGLVLLECLTGRPEYPGSPIESALARLNRQPVIPDRYGPGWATLLRAMTASNPDGRPTGDQVAAALADPDHRHSARIAPAGHPSAAHPLTVPITGTSPAALAAPGVAQDRRAPGTAGRDPHHPTRARGRLARRCGAAVAVAAALITAVTMTGSHHATPTHGAAATGAPPTPASAAATPGRNPTTHPGATAGRTAAPLPTSTGATRRGAVTAAATHPRSSSTAGLPHATSAAAAQSPPAPATGAGRQGAATATGSSARTSAAPPRASTAPPTTPAPSKPSHPQKATKPHTNGNGHAKSNGHGNGAGHGHGK